MPKKHYVVIVLDVNSIPRESPRLYEEEEEVDATASTVVETGVPYKHETIKAVKEAVISLLSKEAMEFNLEKFDFSHVFWSFKIYNSSFEINSKTGRSFEPIGPESMEAFEKQLDDYLNLESQSAVKSDPKVNLVQYLSTALKSVLSDLPWQMPTMEVEDGLEGTDNHNVIHALFRVPAGEDEVKAFVPGWTPVAGSTKIMNELVPKAFAKKMKEYGIRLHCMDMYPAFEDQVALKPDHNWELAETTKPMLKIVHYLAGTISSFTHISKSVPYGLPRYGDLLKMLIEVATKPSGLDVTTPGLDLEKGRKTLRLVQGSLNGSVVGGVGKDDDSESVPSNANNGIRITNPSFALSSLTRNARRSFPEPIDSRRYGFENFENHRRYSDESNNYRSGRMPLQEQFPPARKRKFEFEEDMASEEGITAMDIENWRLMGRVPIKEKSTGDRRRELLSSSFTQGHEQQFEYGVRGGHYSMGGFAGAGAGMQPQKKIKREEYAFPSVIGRNQRQRYSDPHSTMPRPSHEKQQRDNLNVSVSRGQLMANTALKKRNSFCNRSKENVPQEQDSLQGRVQRMSTYWKENVELLKDLKRHLERGLKAIKNKEIVQPECIVEELDSTAEWFVKVVLEQNVNLPPAAQALVTTFGGLLVDLRTRDLRRVIEKVLVKPFEDLNMDVLKLKKLKDQSEEEAIYRMCLLQIFIHFEMVWTIPSNDPSFELSFVEDVTRILSLIKVYLRNVKIEEFIEEELIPLYYPTHSKLLREIVYALNIRDSSILNASLDSPDSGSSSRDDQSISSFNSSLCGPEDSTSQNPNEHLFSQNLNNSQNSIRTSLRTASFLTMRNPKRALVLPFAKQPAKTKMLSTGRSHGTTVQSNSVRLPGKSPKPKKVRRNLFDVQATDPKDMKTLLSLATSSNSPSFTRSPSLFKSPLSKMSSSPRSPGRPSPFFAAARAAKARAKGQSSRRRLILDENSPNRGNGERSALGEHWGTLSHSPNEDLICPEDPFTPASSKKKRTPPVSGKSSLTKSVVRESPELVTLPVVKAEPGTSGKGTTKPSSKPKQQIPRFNSLLFYSAKPASKSQAWERSGKKIIASWSKDSVDVTKELTMEGLGKIELDSPEKTRNDATLRKSNHSEDMMNYNKQLFGVDVAAGGNERNKKCPEETCTFQIETGGKFITASARFKPSTVSTYSPQPRDLNSFNSVEAVENFKPVESDANESTPGTSGSARSKANAQSFRRMGPVGLSSGTKRPVWHKGSPETTSTEHVKEECAPLPEKVESGGSDTSKENNEDLHDRGDKVPPAPAPTQTTSKSPGLDTPSKRVQFCRELVSTPSPNTPARPTSGNTPITPKSILKDSGSSHHTTPK